MDTKSELENINSTEDFATSVLLKSAVAEKIKHRQNAFFSLGLDLVAGTKVSEFGLMPRFKTLRKKGGQNKIF